MMTRRIVGVLGAMAACAAICGAAGWPQFRGPTADGAAAGSEAMPADPTARECLAWAAELPGPAAGTPVVWGDRVFVGSATRGEPTLQALCLAAADGRVLWRRPLGKSRGRADYVGAPSPATDGQRVYFLFGSGDMAAMDLAGQVIWSRNLTAEFGRFSLIFGYCSSPLLHQGRLYVSIVRGEGQDTLSDGRRVKLESLLAAIDPATGKTLWATVRPGDAQGESQHGYSSPVACKTPRGDGIAVVGGDYVTCNDAAGGKELWRYKYPRRPAARQIASPVMVGELLLAPEPRGAHLLAIRPPAPGGEPAVVWSSTAAAPDVCTPLVYKGLLYVLDDQKRALVCLDPAAEGKVLWRHKLPEEVIFRASPVGADDKVYCLGDKGQSFVLAAGREAKALSSGTFNEPGCLASMAVSDGRMYVRTGRRLLCIRVPGNQRE